MGIEDQPAAQVVPTQPKTNVIAGRLSVTDTVLEQQAIVVKQVAKLCERNG
jgi:hypothetical protein